MTDVVVEVSNFDRIGGLPTIDRLVEAFYTGPKLYSVEKGHPRLRQRHLGFKIDSAARDEWLLCMQGALAEAVADAVIRQEIYAAMAKLADWMRNQAGNPHDAYTTLS